MTNLQAEKAAIDKEFYNIDVLAKQDGVTALKKYDQMRKDLIEANSGIEGFEEALDQYLNQVSQLKDTSQGNLPAVYKALQSAQEATKRSTSETLEDGLSMDTMIDLYNSLGNDMFNINFEAMTTDALSQLQKAIEMVQANGEELTMENIIKAVVVLEDGGVNSELMSILQAAQALADANAIKVKIDIVSDFDPSKDLFDPKKRQEFLDAYNDIMGNKEGDADYIDSNDLSLMTSDEIEEMQFRGTQKGRSQEIADAQGRVTEWSGIKEDLEAQQANSRNAVSAAEEAMFGDAAEGADASLLAENAELISEYGNLRNRLKEGLYTAEDGERMSEIVDTLSEAGLTDNAVYDKLSPQAHAITYADQISEYAQLQKFKEQGIATDSDLTRMQGIQNELAGTGIIDDSGNLSQFYAENIKGINGIAEARDNLSGVNEQLATATSELSNAEMDAANSHLAQQELMQQEAEYYNVDMDAVRAYAAELERTGQVQQREKENIQDYHNRLLRLALDYQENTEGLAELQDAYKKYKAALKSEDTIAETNAMNKMKTAISKITKLPINKISKDFMKWAKDSGTLEKALRGDSKAIKELEKQASKVRFNDLTTTFGQAVKAVADSKDDLIATADDMWKGIEEALGNTKVGDILNDIVTSVGNAGEMLNDLFANTFAKNLAANGGDAAQAWADTCDQFAENGIIPEVGEGGTATFTAESQGEIRQFEVVPLPNGGQKVNDLGPWVDPTDKNGEITPPKLTFSNGRAGGGSPGGGGGGGGGGKKPKKVANKRKSQTVKRYKRNDFKRDDAEKAKKFAE